jgi:hypothetical protein
LILNFCNENRKLSARLKWLWRADDILILDHLIFTILFRRVGMAKESVGLKEEAEMTKLNNTR